LFLGDSSTMILLWILKFQIIVILVCTQEQKSIYDLYVNVV
jgi:hypothetical protein